MDRLDSLLERAERALLYVGLAAGAAMMFHVALDVFVRVTFGHAFAATTTVAARYYMVALAFLPLAWMDRTMGQISVDVLTATLRGGWRRAQEAFVGLLTLAYLGLVTWQATVSALRRTQSGEFVDLMVSVVPVWPSRWLVPVACAALVLHVAIRTWRRVFGAEPSRPAGA